MDHRNEIPTVDEAAALTFFSISLSPTFSNTGYSPSKRSNPLPIQFSVWMVKAFSILTTNEQCCCSNLGMSLKDPALQDARSGQSCRLVVGAHYCSSHKTGFEGSCSVTGRGQMSALGLGAFNTTLLGSVSLEKGHEGRNHLTPKQRRGIGRKYCFRAVDWGLPALLLSPSLQ